MIRKFAPFLSFRSEIVTRATLGLLLAVCVLASTASAGNISFYSLGYLNVAKLFASGEPDEKASAALVSVCNEIASHEGIVILSGIPSEKELKTVSAAMRAQDPSSQDLQTLFIEGADGPRSFGIISDADQAYSENHSISSVRLHLQGRAITVPVSVLDLLMESDPGDFFRLVAVNFDTVPATPGIDREELLKELAGTILRRIRSEKATTRAQHLVLFVQCTSPETKDATARLLKEFQGDAYLTKVVVDDTNGDTWNYAQPGTDTKYEAVQVFVNRTGVDLPSHHASTSLPDSDPFLHEDKVRIIDHEAWNVVSPYRPVQIGFSSTPR